ncbi:cytochrome P450 [Hypoxylon fuscum]|nr:cytochrome P450 [Hypoxylon fuscum]
MYYLLRSPKALDRLRGELDTAVEPTHDIASYAEVKNLPYLRACLDESLRLSPPVAFGLNRKTPPEGMFIDGHWIPGNTTVGVPAYTAHRNPDIFPDPEVFRPERWLEDGGKEAQSSFIAFSAGSRGCIGRNITYIEQTILMATLLRRYDFALSQPGWEMECEEAFNLWPKTIPLTIRRREAGHD